MIEITDPQDPRLAPFRSLKVLPNETFVAENPKVIKALLNSSLQVEAFLALPQYYEQFASLLSDKEVSNLYTAKKEILDALIGYRLHHGVLALAKIPASLPLSQLSAPMIALDNLANSENVGSIIRSANAFGFENLILDSKSSPPYQRRAVRASMGTVFSTNIHTCTSLAQTLTELKKQGILIIGAEITPDAKPLSSFTPNLPYVVIFGAEGEGLSSDVMKLCDTIVFIPLENDISLNVGAAAAIFFYHLRKSNPS